MFRNIYVSLHNSVSSSDCKYICPVKFRGGRKGTITQLPQISAKRLASEDIKCQVEQV